MNSKKIVVIISAIVVGISLGWLILGLLSEESTFYTGADQFMNDHSTKYTCQAQIDQNYSVGIYYVLDDNTEEETHALSIINNENQLPMKTDETVYNQYVSELDQYDDALRFKGDFPNEEQVDSEYLDYQIVKDCYDQLELPEWE